ncbi:MAG: helicase [Hydrogenophaga sp.]|uniref:helicase n=1 Tax=Hydrogenophaga sp. TaxID=1904254 RepID=UPI0025BDC7C0|nr:helicase [Hydrogenophaga sp.]MBT9550689.1 helicase [Hydrogenophaga sp.]
MLKFKFLLWAFAHLLQRKIRSNPDCARYVGTKKLVFQIRTASGAGRTYVLQDGAVRSLAGLSAAPGRPKQARSEGVAEGTPVSSDPAFTLSFSTPAKGFEILSAKDAQPAFLRGVGSQDLVISGDFREVLWFQGLTSYLQPPKVIAAWDRSPF